MPVSLMSLIFLFLNLENVVELQFLALHFAQSTAIGGLYCLESHNLFYITEGPSGTKDAVTTFLTTCMHTLCH